MPQCEGVTEKSADVRSSAKAAEMPNAMTTDHQVTMVFMSASCLRLFGTQCRELTVTVLDGDGGWDYHASMALRPLNFHWST